MFCDLVGSTAMSARLDPEDMRDVIRAYQDACSRRGRALSTASSPSSWATACWSISAFPRAHEDDAERAARAGLGHRGRRARSCETSASVALEVRIGIATGIVVVGELMGRATAQEQASSARRPIWRRGCRRWPSRAAS